jgi:hypothetical protein
VFRLSPTVQAYITPPRGSTSTPSHAPVVCAAPRAESIQAAIKRRCACSTKYAAHLSLRGPDGRDVLEAATVVGPRHIATFAHAPHNGWALGREVQVRRKEGAMRSLRAPAPSRVAPDPQAMLGAIRSRAVWASHPTFAQPVHLNRRRGSCQHQGVPTSRNAWRRSRCTAVTATGGALCRRGSLRSTPAATS